MGNGNNNTTQRIIKIFITCVYNAYIDSLAISCPWRIGTNMFHGGDHTVSLFLLYPLVIFYHTRLLLSFFSFHELFFLLLALFSLSIFFPLHIILIFLFSPCRTILNYLIKLIFLFFIWTSNHLNSLFFIVFFFLSIKFEDRRYYIFSKIRFLAKEISNIFDFYFFIIF